MVDFRLDDEQRQVLEMMRKFAQEELRKVARECDEKAELPAGILQKVWELGICANTIPESYGGYGLGRSIVTGAIIAEELANGDMGLALGALSPWLMLTPLLEFGTEEQKKQWLGKFCGEKYFPATAALMEPRVTFDATALETVYEKSGDKFILNGVKCMVPIADTAEHIVVYATSAKGAGASSVQAFIVDKGAPGMTVGAREKYMGLRPLPLYQVSFKDCEVAADRKIGGDAGINYMRLLNISRTVLCAMAVGVSRASTEYSIKYAKEREAFGEPIASRQAIAFMLAEMAMETDGMRLLAWRAAWMLDKKEDATRETTIAKTYCADQTMKIVDYGVQILGGHGYIREHPVELYFRNGRSLSSIEGLAMA